MVVDALHKGIQVVLFQQQTKVIFSKLQEVIFISSIAKTPKPPYYAVIFASQRTDGDRGYAEMAQKMVQLAEKQTGFLGIESARDNSLGITVSYWDSTEAIAKWKAHAEHKIAQKRGRTEWYKEFAFRVCKVERDGFSNI